MLVMYDRFPRLASELTRMVHQRFVFRNEHPTAGGGNDFISVEGEGANASQRPRMPITIATA